MTEQTVANNTLYNGVITSQISVKSLQNNTYANYFLKPDTVSISENNHVQDGTEGKGLTTGAKVAIATGIVSALTVGIELIFCKGKHFKSLFGKIFNKGGKSKGKPTGNNRTNRTGNQTTHTTQNLSNTVNSVTFDGKSPVNITDYTQMQQKAREFAIKEGLSENMYNTNLSPETIYMNAVALKYKNLRNANYKINGRYNPNIDKITGSQTSEIVVNNQNFWNYRIPKTGTFKDKSVDRISLNVYPEEQLITSLDKYFASGKVKGYYKTPDELNLWSMRHDPITIYLQEPVTQSILDDIIKISKPHIRSTEDVLIGKTVSPGVALDKSPSTQELIDLIQEARQYDEILAHQLETSTKYGFARNAQCGDYTLHTSAGQAAAVRALLDDLAKVKIANNMRAQILNKYKINGDIERPMTLYSDACRKNYDKIRLCSEDIYPLRPTCDPNIANITNSNSKNVYVNTDGMAWAFRYANKNKGIEPPCVDRISINVYPEENLIRELDDFISNTRVNVDYKTPEDFIGWQKRHDSITIYFREPIPQDVKDEVIKIVSPYVRPCPDGIMIGKKLADGIYQVAEPTEQDVLALIDRASKLGDNKLVECLKSPEKQFGADLYQYSSSGKVKLRTSPGAVKAVEMLLDDLEKICGK